MCDGFTKELGEIFEFVCLSSSSEIRDILSPYEASDELLEQTRVVVSKQGGWRGAIKSITYTKRSDFVYTRSVEIALLIALRGNRFALEVHSPGFERSIFWRLVFSWLLRHQNLVAVVAISKALKDILVNQCAADPMRLIVHHDAGDICPVSDSSTKDGIKVGYVGSLYPGRGIELIFALAEKFPDIEFHVVGGGDVPKSVPANIFLHGYVSYSQAKTWRKKMSILLAPYQVKTLTAAGVDSTSWMSPIKIFEYMSSGKPFICSDLPVLREVLESEHDCLLVEPENVDAWASALSRLIASQELSSALATNAERKVRELYNWDKRAKMILEHLGFA